MRFLRRAARSCMNGTPVSAERSPTRHVIISFDVLSNAVHVHTSPHPKRSRISFGTKSGTCSCCNNLCLLVMFVKGVSGFLRYVYKESSGHRIAGGGDSTCDVTPPCWKESSGDGKRI